MNHPPTLTILHSCSDPPSSWLNTFYYWTSCACSPSLIEYVLIVDAAKRRDLGQYETLIKNSNRRHTIESVVDSFRIVLNKGVPNHTTRLLQGLKIASPTTSKIAVTDKSNSPAVHWDVMPVDRTFCLREDVLITPFVMIGDDLAAMFYEPMTTLKDSTAEFEGRPVDA